MLSTGIPGSPRNGRHPLWTALLEALRDHFPAQLIDELELHVRVLEVTPSTLSLAAPGPQLATWLRDGRRRVLDRVLGRWTDYVCEPAFLPLSADAGEGPGTGRTLESFVASPANDGLRAVATMVLDHPGQGANPLLLRGTSAAGKTHLLSALAHGLYQAVKPAPVLLLNAEDFSLDLVAAIRRDGLAAFRRALGACGALLVDDIDRLTGRGASQYELARALEAMRGSQTQVVMTASQGADPLRELDEVLREQLHDAVSLDLLAPEWETRVAIVLERAAGWELEASLDVASLVVAKLGNDLRRLDAVLTRLITHPLCNGHLRDAALAQRILGQAARPSGMLPPEAVIQLVTQHFNVRLSDMRSESRSPRVTTPRQIAMYLVRRHSGLSYPEIGQRFRRHHTTALHACRRITRLRDQNAGVHAALGLLEKELRRLAESSE